MKSILILMSVFIVSACGFRPMYGEFSDGQTDLRDVMANIRVDSITENGRPSRIGQIIRNEMLDRLTPFGETKSAEYILKVTYLVEEAGYGIRQNESVTLQNVKLVASFQLEEVDSSKILLQSVSRALVTFDLVQSDYSNMIARNAALRRLAQDVANQMSTRIGAYFSKNVVTEIETKIKK